MSTTDEFMTANEFVARLAAALDACGADQRAALDMPHRDDWENVARCARLALVCARTSAWWACWPARHTSSRTRTARCSGRPR
ncbi:hypothetical protein [Pseudonocardia sp.]|jgi:hypothetical protein|uniref:hypothetical protein n=1 Tax=Pseudonocardia sp. TaxID=60912 RepID=UPI00261D8391|nr:hypothetical protein [Pseudonocardia sp.]MCW2718937.1 hypothetical protein [Pseudonocardia sp.]